MNTPTPPPFTPIAGRLRLATQIDGQPVALDAWRATTEDLATAERIQAVLGGTAPAEWPSTSRDRYEVMTAATELDILLDGDAAIQQRFIRREEPGWMSNGASIILPDGERIPDPNKHLTFAERRGLARADGTQCVTTVYLRLAAAPELALIFRSASWDLAWRWREAGLLTALAGASRDVPVPGTLTLAQKRIGAGASIASARLHIHA